VLYISEAKVNLPIYIEKPLIISKEFDTIKTILTPPRPKNGEISNEL
jgi:hypothetical protein